ncbi:MAG TPA: PH domain-containing protein [Actinomycetota bacterium]|nr:PH domain-containing protein [Actinomycetota bacterium]
MAFPRSLLAEHEDLVFDLKPHWVALVPPVLWTIVSIVALFLGYRAVDAIFDDATNTAKMVWGAVVTVAWIVLAVVPAMRRQFTMFVLTTDRLITRSGIIAKESREIPLERINDVTFTQSVVERMLGAGDLLIESAGERGQTRITDVRKPEQVQLMIYKQTEDNSTRIVQGQVGTAMSQREAAAPDSVTDQLEDLGRLRKQGVITEEEFQAKKSELLKRL